MNFLPRTWSRLLAVASLVWRPLSLQAEDTIEEFRAKAEQGDAQAQFNLGFCYDNGMGVVKDEAEAVKWYRKAAEQGDAKAQVHLGIWYDDGTGVVKDETKAAKGYRKAQGSSCLACGTAVNFC